MPFVTRHSGRIAFPALIVVGLIGSLIGVRILATARTLVNLGTINAATPPKVTLH